MKKSIVFIFYLTFSNFINCAKIQMLIEEIKKIKITDFNKSANLDCKSIYFLNNNKFTRDLLKLYRNIYSNNNPSKVLPTIEPKIPKVMHQIWLGSKFPERFKSITKKWLTMHTDWQYKLWTDKNIKDLFPLHNQKYFDESKNYGEKSDLLRYEILYRFGGVYVDIDYECINSFNVLNHTYEFYAGMEPLRLSPLSIGNSIIGSKAGHPILKECIETIKDFQEEKFIPKRTGPLHLTRAFLKVRCLKDIIIFPPTYFYPLRSYETLRRMDKANNIYAESLGIHYWARTW